MAKARSGVLRPNRGWFFVAAGVTAAWVLERIDAPLWLAIITLALLLVAALAWPWIEHKLIRQIMFWSLLITWGVVVVGVVMTIRRPSPVLVTKINYDHPEVGKPLVVRVYIRSTGAAPKVRSIGAVTVVGSPDNKNIGPQLEARLWKNYERFAKEEQAIIQEIPAPEGDDLTIILDTGNPLKQVDVDRFHSGNAVIYVLGQIDYGYGAFDYCRFSVPPHRQVMFCLEHNGRSSQSRAAFMQ